MRLALEVMPHFICQMSALARGLLQDGPNKFKHCPVGPIFIGWLCNNGPRHSKIMTNRYGGKVIGRQVKKPWGKP